MKPPPINPCVDSSGDALLVLLVLVLVLVLSAQPPRQRSFQLFPLPASPIQHRTAGDADFICNYLGNEAWALRLKWSGTEGFNSAEQKEWTPAGSDKSAGLSRSYEGFTFLQVYEAGHMVRCAFCFNCMFRNRSEQAFRVRSTMKMVYTDRCSCCLRWYLRFRSRVFFKSSLGKAGDAASIQTPHRVYPT